VQKYIFAAAVLLCPASGSAALADDLMKQAQDIFKPLPSATPTLEGNPATPAKVELGKQLFFDPRLSASEVISCNSCHNLVTGGVDAGPTSVGHAWQLGGRRSPSVLNAVFNIAQFWDGRAPDLRTQAQGPVQNPVEMAATPEHVVDTLNSIPAYQASFRHAFPGEAKPVTFDNFGKAIEAFEATLTTPGSRFDKYLQGDAKALNVQEQQGLKLFMDKGCAACHNGVNIGGGAYFKFGVVASPGDAIRPPADKGRSVVTKSPDDDYVFRVAPLRNVALRAPYFHSGKVWSLKEAVGVMAASQLGQTLTGPETDAIVAFLGTLTGTQPKVELPVLPARTGTTPLPHLSR
jgi:cytochrome c peroxidase